MNAALRVSQLLLCVGLVASSVYASAGINRCVSADGKVLLTDADCPPESRPDVSDDGAVGVAINSGVSTAAPSAPVVLAVAPPRSRWADLPRPLVRKSIGLDAGTLQAAYQTMQLDDEMRRQRHLVAQR
ncbi:hypothetical protein RugamoR64_36080 [Duganella rhizosphaerae]|uniref:hypothetical protein n=1 Tax=Duganella rhizosphaerae TaxID=2885763 RepID=UPI0030E8BB18